ncbi:gastrin/cholecystokinin-like peptide [Triplophysa dalaica]|uniref:gastrin/cholecystokinin-like peptide n=1 Tax=Triplophysa dalaica TaxID=1582913 RepID=UPI0024DFF5F2|nr:gastrin/cholecystokinin-like peptide [Triplophysa dalaica]
MMARCIALAVTVMLVVACVASPLSEDTPVSTNESTPQADRTIPETRVRRSPLPEDQRELISRQILQALSEIVQREDCITDYQGWVDFGRRSTD